MKFPYNAINQAGNAVKQLGLYRLPTDPDYYMQRAIKKAGCTDFGHPHFKTGLEILLQSLTRDVNLHFIGVNSIRHILLQNLVNRLLITRESKKEGFKDIKLNPPIVVTGIPRSGTTFLHRLLGEDPNHVVIPLWQLLEPVPRKLPDRRFRRTRMQIRMKNRIIPDLDRKHFSRVDTPEECIVLQASTFVSQLYWDIAPVYQYLQWYSRHDRLQSYRDYLLFLKYFQWQNPGKRLVLKAPAHLGALNALKTVMPDAMLVQTHRDPAVSITSVNSLHSTLYRLFTDQFDKAQMARTSMNYRWDDARKGLEYDEAHPGEIFHVSFKELHQNPMDTAVSIYAHYNLPLSEKARSNMIKYSEEYPKNKFGRHQYSGESFQLPEDEIRETFAPYIHRFEGKMIG